MWVGVYTCAYVSLWVPSMFCFCWVKQQIIIHYGEVISSSDWSASICVPLLKININLFLIPVLFFVYILSPYCLIKKPNSYCKQNCVAHLLCNSVAASWTSLTSSWYFTFLGDHTLQNPHPKNRLTWASWIIFTLDFPAWVIAGYQMSESDSFCL